jgi:hypothetical protein
MVRGLSQRSVEVGEEARAWRVAKSSHSVDPLVTPQNVVLVWYMHEARLRVQAKLRSA